MNLGAFTLGALDGLLIGLLAVGVVLVYRSSRFLNLAHGQLGALPAMLLLKLVLDEGWGYWPALIICLAVGAVTGIAVERYLVARLRAHTSSAVSALLLMVGVTQLLLAFTTIPWLEPDIGAFASKGYPLPTHSSFEFDGVVFGGQYLAIAIFCPLLVAGVTLFLRYSLTGKMIRANACNEDAARLCGVSPRLVNAITWGLAGVLSTFSAVLASPNTFSSFSAGGLGPLDLFLALGAAAFGSFVSIPRALLGGIVIGVVDASMVYETSNTGVARLVVFLLVLAVILVRGRSIGAVFATSGAAVEDRPPTRVPIGVRQRVMVRHHRRLLVGAGLFVGALLPLLPPFSSQGNRFLLSLVLVYALVGVSLTILIGWAGQLSLGHMAVVGVAAFVAARLANNGYSLLALLAVCGTVGALILIAVGLPALRVPGLTLAVTTLGLAVVAPEWILRAKWISASKTSFVSVTPIKPLPNISPGGSLLTVYWISLGTLLAAGLIAYAIRHSTPGRTMIAVRDNEAASAAYGLTPTTVKLTVLAVSGCVAGMAGVLWANAWQQVTPDQFTPQLSLTLLALPIVGGVGSIGGAIAAAVLINVPAFFITPHLTPLLGDFARGQGFQYVFGGLGVVGVLLAYPTGIAGAAQRGWEKYLVKVDDYLRHRAVEQTSDSVLSATDVELHFGGVRALQGASIEVRRGEIVGLIGPNGAGKSTLMNVISGVLRPDRGTILLRGEDISDLAPEMRAALGLGRSFQAADLFPGLTVREAIQTVLGASVRIGVLSSAVRAPWARDAERRMLGEADVLLERMGLERWSDSLVAELSTGTRRICDFTLQMAAKADVLLLDEPTAGVAQRDTEMFGPLLRRMREELDCSILIVEHDMPLLMGVCDRVYAMVEGSVIVEGTADEVRNDPRVIASYLGTDERAVARSGAQASNDAPRRHKETPTVSAVSDTNGSRRVPKSATPPRSRRARPKPLVATRNGGSTTPTSAATLKSDGSPSRDRDSARDSRASTAGSDGTRS